MLVESVFEAVKEADRERERVPVTVFDEDLVTELESVSAEVTLEEGDEEPVLDELAVREGDPDRDVLAVDAAVTLLLAPSDNVAVAEDVIDGEFVAVELDDDVIDEDEVRVGVSDRVCVAEREGLRVEGGDAEREAVGKTEAEALGVAVAVPEGEMFEDADAELVSEMDAV